VLAQVPRSLALPVCNAKRDPTSIGERASSDDLYRCAQVRIVRNVLAFATPTDHDGSAPEGHEDHGGTPGDQRGVRAVAGARLARVDAVPAVARAAERILGHCRPVRNCRHRTDVVAPRNAGVLTAATTGRRRGTVASGGSSRADGAGNGRGRGWGQGKRS